MESIRMDRDKLVQEALDLAYLKAIDSWREEHNDDALIKVLYDLVDRDHIPSMTVLAQFYQDGIGVVTSDAKAIDLYRKAADLGSDYAQGKLSSFN